MTNRSQEGSQFCRGFGGIGGVLRYQVDTNQFDERGDESSASELWTSDEVSDHSSSHSRSRQQPQQQPQPEAAAVATVAAILLA